MMMVTMRVDHEMLANKRVVAVLLLVSFALLAATFFPGVGRTVNGARGWLKAGPAHLPACGAGEVHACRLPELIPQRQEGAHPGFSTGPACPHSR